MLAALLIAPATGSAIAGLRGYAAQRLDRELLLSQVEGRTTRLRAVADGAASEERRGVQLNAPTPVLDLDAPRTPGERGPAADGPPPLDGGGPLSPEIRAEIAPYEALLAESSRLHAEQRTAQAGVWDDQWLDPAYERLVRTLAAAESRYRAEAEAAKRPAGIRAAIAWAGVAAAIWVLLHRLERTRRREERITADQRALRESEARFRSLVQHSHDVLTIVDAEGIIRYQSSSADRVLGLEPDERIGRRVFEGAGIHPDDLEKSRALITQLLATPRTVASAEMRLRHDDGSWRSVETIGSNLLDDPDVAGIVLNTRDVTEHRRAQEALRESEQRYELVARATNDVIWDMDVESDRITWTGAVETMFGYSVDEIKGGSWWDERVHPDDRERVVSGSEAVFRGEVEGDAWSDEYRFRCGDGSYASVIDRGTVLRDAEGRPIRMIGSMMDISARKALEQQLAHQAFHDPLTALPNRALFLDRLDHALARGSRRPEGVAVLFMDLDRFKVINDSLGHEVGDLLLVAVGDRLKSCLRPQDTAARLGGDEFTVLLEDVRDAADAARVAHRIAQALEQPFRIGPHDVYVSTSIGIALADRASGYTGSGTASIDLLRDADIAMYRAKAKGRASYEVFDAAMGRQSLERMEMETSLRRATERGEFRLFYQPNLDIATGEIVGAEALVRWEHPERGLVPPFEFIPLAEETGLIMRIGRWVLEEACRQAVEWRAMRPWDPPSISVNLSVRQLQRPYLANEVAEVLAASGLPPGSLTLEITESVIMEDAAGNAATLARLKELGVRLAVDDFGTGYSSLAYLRRLPVDIIKVDKSFIDSLGKDREGAAIVEAVTTLAHTLGKQVTAEGIETPEQLACLRSLGCEYGQGYLFSRPVPIGEMVALLTAAPAPAAATA